MEAMKPARDIHALIETLRGTCLSLEEGCQRHGYSEDDLTQPELETIDGEICHCEQCSWWDDVGESKDGVCNDCLGDAGEE